MKKLILVLIIMSCYSCNAQQKKNESNCNRNSWAKWIENELPETICVQKGEMIYSLFNEFDFNSDGLQDIAIKIGKKERKNGDVRKLSVYKKVNDSIYTKFKTLNNIYPIWFNDYDSSVKLKDPKLNKIKEYYEMGNPLRKLTLEKSKITLNLKGDSVTEYILTFIFSKEKQDWLLSNYIEFDLNNNTKRPYLTERLNTSISDFTYLEFLNGEY
ncbi:hypothetical protein [uncultured Polaribacter sp.]|uniref:hypothetical protein n=1 Tax=uncultured Polaribacter sp. TaxID=174711 RepID=UPI00260504CF|nr:hypothetical protein [uncultured Polaribacter sp.]